MLCRNPADLEYAKYYQVLSSSFAILNYGYK